MNPFLRFTLSASVRNRVEALLGIWRKKTDKGSWALQSSNWQKYWVEFVRNEKKKGGSLKVEDQEELTKTRKIKWQLPHLIV